MSDHEAPPNPSSDLSSLDTTLLLLMSSIDNLTHALEANTRALEGRERIGDASPDIAHVPPADIDDAAAPPMREK